MTNGIIGVSLPKMGGVVIINGIEFDERKYYEGRGVKYNKNINHEKVIVKITQNELAKAIRHFKANKKHKDMRKAQIRKDGKFTGQLQYAITISRKLYYPELKEISRTKI